MNRALLDCGGSGAALDSPPEPLHMPRRATMAQRSQSGVAAAAVQKLCEQECHRRFIEEPEVYSNIRPDMSHRSVVGLVFFVFGLQLGFTQAIPVLGVADKSDNTDSVSFMVPTD